jgi:hypothetical protein
MPLTESQRNHVDKAYRLTAEALDEFRKARLSPLTTATSGRIQSSLSLAKLLLERILPKD